MKNDDLMNTMASRLMQEPEELEPAKAITTEAPAEKPKRRRRSLIDKDPLPEAKKKRQRRQKDPALKKTYSMTVLMTEEMHRRLKNIAEIQELSMNGIVTRLIRRYIMTHDIDLTDL